MRYYLAALLALASVSLTACDSESSPAQAGDVRPDSSVTPPADDPNNPPPPRGLGPSCVSSDANRQCIGLKVVSYADSQGTPSLSLARAVAMLEKVNAIWSGCNIQFQIDEYLAVDPSDYGLTFGAGSQNELGTIRQRFANNSTFLLAVTGPWSGQYIAWTQLPGAGPYGAIVDQQYGGDAIAVGHELGHYMSLDHYQTLGNVMYSIVYPQDTSVVSSQCTQARAANSNYWKAMLRR